MNEPNLSALSPVELLRAQPGDIVILRHPERLSIEAYRNMRDQLKAIMPSGVQVIVLHEGAEIKLLRPEKAERYVVEGRKDQP